MKKISEDLAIQDNLFKKKLKEFSDESLKTFRDGDKAFLDGLLSKKNSFKNDDKSLLLNSFIKKSIDLKFIQVSDEYLSMFIVTNKSYYIAEKFYSKEELIAWSAIEIYKKQKKTKVNYESIRDKAVNHMLVNYFNKKEFLNGLVSEGIDFYCWQEKYS